MSKVQFLFTEDSENGLSKRNIEVIIEEINRLQNLYPDIVIKRIGDIYTKDKLEFEELKKTIKDNKIKENPIKMIEPTIFNNSNDKNYNDFDFYARYCPNERSIYFNHKVINEYFKNPHRRHTPEDIFIKELVWHEWGHAIGFQYCLDENKELISIFEETYNVILESLLDDDRVSNDIHEMIACGFVESEFGKNLYQITTDIRSVIERVVKENKPLSEEEKNKIKMRKLFEF